MFHNYAAGQSGNPVLDGLRSDRAPNPFQDDFLDVPAQDAPANITPHEALKIVAAAFAADPLVFGRQLCDACGGFEAFERYRPRKPIVPMPFHDISAIEVSIGDAYSPKSKRKPKRTPKRVRKDQEILRYTAAVQVWQDGAREFKDKAWSGVANLRAPERLLLDLERKFTKSTKTREPFSAEFVEFLTDQVVPIARSADMMIGLLSSVVEGEGTQFHEGQVVLVPCATLSGNGAKGPVLLHYGDSIILPRFDRTDFKGNSLKGDFEFQSRGLLKFPFAPFKGYADWGTGKIDL